MSSFDFNGQTAIVTGGTRGIGRAISQSFLDAGATVVATYAGNEGAAEAFAAELGDAAERLETRKFDVSDYEAVEAFYRDIDKDYASLEILVNNAGIRRDSIVGMMSLEDWQQVVGTNLTGTYSMSKFAVHKMMQSRYGRIINITSPSGQMGFEGQANYAATKAGIVAFTKSLSKEVAKRKITVNCVSPGFIDTEFIGDLPDDQMKAYKGMVPMRRFGTPEEVAHSVLFLASRASTYITGATLDVTGGL
ncbi:MAG: 3-oxoacyl-ACP reductase FabG [Lentisphaerae bacterium]|jgi:3-oxoacyl-[acyl-carrier protein] reductase|nr:3-oxoacyl-ACP reductase FabG [Lentisphaerota bacterium]MBT4821547.1 3-oxoacyl-ACP reductase FabG [Lentisphaerota bacterium]MBT5610302.1 3-oxoacyl-ACP reductase FabG [Lentisphaerota bacterium]MBT7056407.1 3-oxoacyl-ACP reductase FabG [Lentisphaerota bacterium]MBT7848221.1 3-oxoacyl-ACP reductase FabG [Lentisphaerota bacterium]